MRFYVVDPQEEFASPYLYCGNNPIIFVDPDGEFALIGDAILAGVTLFAGWLAAKEASDNLKNQNLTFDTMSEEEFDEFLDSKGREYADLIDGYGKAYYKSDTDKSSSQKIEMPSGNAVNPEPDFEPEDDGSLKKQKNKPKQNGKPNSRDIQYDSKGRITKYTEFDKDGNFLKEVRRTGKPHGKLPKPNVKVKNINVNPKTGQEYFNGYKVREMTSKEIIWDSKGFPNF